LNGQLLDVGENLHAALTYVGREQSTLQRHIDPSTGSELLLWADAICLDQTNEQEKAHQIPRMGTIFSYAVGVVIWFGNLAQISEAKIQLFVETVNHVSLHDEILDRSPTPFRERLGDQFADFMEAFRLILGQEWFSRVWTTQEYVRSKQSPLAVVEGRLITMYGITLSSIAMGILSQKGELNDVETETYFNFLRRMVVMANLHNTFERIRSESYLNMSLAEQLLHSFGTLERKHATLPHDHIYGLLGMITVSELPQNLMPDYTLPFQQVFHSYIRHIVENTGSLSTLGCSGDEFLDLPSWVPDLRVCRFPTLTESAQAGSVSFSADGKRLTVGGTVIGSVSASLPRLVDLTGKDMFQFRDVILATSARIKNISVSDVFQEFYLSWTTSYEGLIQSELPTLSLEELIDASLPSSRIMQDDFYGRAFCVLKYGTIVECGVYDEFEHNYAEGHEVWALEGAPGLAVLCASDEDYIFKGFCELRSVIDLKLDKEFFSLRSMQAMTLV
jgi:hypothetical protein